jgi:HK97 family phage prohead protease
MRSTHSPSNDLEIRRATSAIVDVDGDRVIRGYPIVFNKLSQDLGGFRERILPRAVDRSMKADIRALVDHDTAKVLGRTKSGTLSLRKEQSGLRIEIEPDQEISYARDIVRSINRGDVSGMSFGFRVLEQEWHEDAKVPIRDVLDIEIFEFSVVTFPAYQDSSVEVAQRALDLYRQTKAYEWRAKWHEISQIAK